MLPNSIKEDENMRRRGDEVMRRKEPVTSNKYFVFKRYKQEGQRD
jgi:hypothetical protein